MPAATRESRFPGASHLGRGGAAVLRWHRGALGRIVARAAPTKGGTSRWPNPFSPTTSMRSLPGTSIACRARTANRWPRTPATPASSSTPPTWWGAHYAYRDDVLVAADLLALLPEGIEPAPPSLRRRADALRLRRARPVRGIRRVEPRPQVPTCCGRRAGCRASPWRWCPSPAPRGTGRTRRASTSGWA